MGKNRYVNTRMWRDEYFSELDPSEKLLFVYCLTCPDTGLCGIYEIPLKIIATDTGLDRDMVRKILDRFENDRKVLYRDGWLAIKNFMRYQKFNPKVEIAVKNELEAVPVELKEWVKEDSIPIAYRKPIDRYNISKNIDKSIDIDKNKNKRFTPPSIREIQDYLNEREISDIDPETFHAFYESKGWRVGNTPMKSWKAAVTTWVKRGVKKRTSGQVSRTTQNVIAFVKGNQDDSNDIR